MLTREQITECYNWHTQRRRGGPTEVHRNGGYGRPAPVQRWLDWRALWWHELTWWLDEVKANEAAQRGEGDTK